MSDSDQSIYTLRYNQTSQQIEGFGGGSPMWSQLIIQNPDPVAGITQLTGDVTAGPGSGSQAATIATGHVTPAKISAVNTDIFSFPSEVILLRGANGLFPGDSTLVLKGASADTVLVVDSATRDRLIVSAGTQGFIIDPTIGVVMGSDIIAASTNIKCGQVVTAGTVTPDASAILQADSTAKGFLYPRMTTTQRDAVATPAEGLQVYDTTTHLPAYWNGSAWVESSGGGSPAGANTQVQYNNEDSFGGVSNLLFDGTNLTIAPGGGGINLNLVSDTAKTGGLLYTGPVLSLFTNEANDVVQIESVSGTGLVVGDDGTESQVNINAASAGTFTPSATLELVSTTKGFLPPRMTTTQKNAITSPAEGLMVYDTDLHKLCVWTGAAWETVTSA